ncbi:YwmB family TATA-box binding protein [Sporolactobacillus sp. THM19-2]|uniref:YwmB family TATA-box binding protein n=1 Tax=Sporolactobacillus sp. THM19-2 TaxID=2511171 RepID=UPI001021CF3C|nr:YwmB family TATA-box binding protein [Sporolactobacillus sp. THM19-2]RYL93988.1 hypothetical protein EWH91_02225 [Sporolactobacillus sp. THM19-2]
MKKKVLCIIFLSLLLPAFPAGAESVKKDIDPIDRVALFAETLDRQATVTGWNVYAREQQADLMTETEFAQRIEQIREKEPEYAWHMEKKQHGVISWTGSKEKSGLKTRVSYMAWPAGKLYRIGIIYQSGAGAFSRPQWTEQERNIRDDITKIFLSQGHIFSCVRAYSNDKMESGLREAGNDFLRTFSAGATEAFYEKTFVSISAYTRAWNDSINSGNKKMNIQVALRDDRDRTVITVGTPIITQEY